MPSSARPGVMKIDAARSQPRSGDRPAALLPCQVMRILGVDPGSRVCGYGVVEFTPPASSRGGQTGELHYRYVECGVLTANGDAPMEERLGEIARWLSDVITDLRPVAVAVEDVFARVNVRSALSLAQARGMVLAVAGMAGLSVYSYAPAVVKKTVTGRGRASKEQVAAMVRALVGLRQSPRTDAADALAVAITHAQHSVLARRIGVLS